MAFNPVNVLNTSIGPQIQSERSLLLRPILTETPSPDSFPLRAPASPKGRNVTLPSISPPPDSLLPVSPPGFSNSQDRSPNQAWHPTSIPRLSPDDAIRCCQYYPPTREPQTMRKKQQETMAICFVSDSHGGGQGRSPRELRPKTVDNNGPWRRYPATFP